LGLVASLNRPGANLTGVANLQEEMGPKRLQLIRELAPDAARFGVLMDPAFPTTQSIITDLQAAARTLGLQLLVMNAKPITSSKRPSEVFRNNALVRSWSAALPSSTGARNNSRRWRPAMRCPRSSPTLSTPWPAA
jgi:ABC-type uncharacterized transport system substrate-binding protein